MPRITKIFLPGLLLVFISVSAFCQSGATIGLGMQVALEQLEKSGDLQKEMHFLVEGELARIENSTKSLGGSYKFGLKGIASVSLRASSIPDLAKQNGINRIEYMDAPGTVLSDFLRVNNNLDSVHMGLGGLPSPLQGENVIIGVIDSGLDWRNEDLQNADGTTRVISIWDQLIEDSTNMQSTFGYGYEWTREDIDNGICNHDPNVEGGHGTGSAGLAAGNGQKVGKYMGGAPKADMIHVNILFDEFFISRFVDAVAYIFEKADEAGLPCVINSSVGSYRGPHDDRGLEVEIIENLLDARTGRVLVQAAGNGALPIANNSCNYWHLSYPVTQDTSVTFFRYSSVVGTVFFDMYADTADFNNVWFSMGPRNRVTLEDLGHTRWFNVIEDLDLHINPTGVLLDTVYVNNSIYGIVRVDIQLVEGVYEMLFRVPGSISSDYWELHTTGAGQFDVWSSRQLIGTSKISRCALPTVQELPLMAHYQYPDTLKTLVSSWACSDKVITVANYSNLDSYEYFGGGTQPNSVPHGELVYDSSTGPTRDGRQKPDIASSGNFTFATTVLEILEDLKINAPSKVAPEGFHAAFSGTSAAAPVVSGAVACYLELFPDATWQEVKNAVIENAVVDSLVLLKGAVPNFGFGHGKLDGYSFINNSILYGCTDENSSNFDPLANVDDGSCEIVSTFDPESSEFRIVAYPNPFYDQVNFSFSVPTSTEAEVHVIDALGRFVEGIKLVDSSGNISISTSSWTKGVYFYNLVIEGKTMIAGKLIHF